MLVFLTVFLLSLRIAGADAPPPPLTDDERLELEGLVSIAAAEIGADDLADTLVETEDDDEIVAEARERARGRSPFGRVDLSIGWRRHEDVTSSIARGVVMPGPRVRHELWLTAAWRM